MKQHHKTFSVTEQQEEEEYFEFQCKNYRWKLMQLICEAGVDEQPDGFTTFATEQPENDDEFEGQWTQHSHFQLCFGSSKLG